MIQLTTSGEESRLTLHEGSEELGHISFRVLPETSIAVAEHTRVSPEHQGKGIAAKLATSFFEPSSTAKAKAFLFAPSAPT